MARADNLLMLDYENKYWKAGYKSIAGVDEAGRGPLAGPVVCAAVVLRSHKFKSLINDSKLLTARQRDKAYLEIKENACIGLAIVNEKIIDKVNILQATLIGMRRAVSFLYPPADCLLVDGNCPIGLSIFSKNIIKGDSKSLSIACASIVAKVTRDRIMAVYHRFWPLYDFLSHKGYPTKNHIKLLKRLGPSPIHRMSFSHVC